MISVQILINAVDLSAGLYGMVTVSATEGEARLAEFTLNPASGTLNPYDWIGQSVIINYIDGASTRLFTGIVHAPKYDISTGLTHFICTDNLQEAVETISRSAIDALIPGYWDEAVFNDPEENWSYAQQRISCYAGAFDKSAAGVLRSTAWQAKTTPDFTFIDSDIIEKTLDISLAERRNIINSIAVKFSSRYERLWQRELTASWQAPFMTPFQGYLANRYQLPTKTMISEALSQWIIKAVAFTDMPPSGTYGGIFWGLTDYGRELAQAMTATVATRWKQAITDNYTITVQSAASISQHGALAVERSHSKQSEQNVNFTDFKEYAAPVGDFISTGNYIAKNEQTISNALLCAIHQAKTEILRSHRSNSVQFSAVLQPDLDVANTVYVNHSKLQAKGKVYSFVHTIDTLQGRAVTDIQLAVFLPNVASQADTTITAPSSPYANPTGLPSQLSALSTYIGNITGAPAQDSNWLGWIGNYDSWSGTPPAPEVYDPAFVVEFPEITEGAAVEHNGSYSYNVAIPQDTLVIIK